MPVYGGIRIPTRKTDHDLDHLDLHIGEVMI